MARRLIPLEEAAQLLGVSPAALNEMRERHEVSAYKDGASWKFKSDEIERLKADRNRGDAPTAEFAEFEDDQESILVSDVELGGSSPGTSSTIIGKTSAPDGDIELAKSGPGASDVKLADNLDLLPSGSGLSSKFDDLDTLDLDLPSAADSGITKPKSDLKLGEHELALGESDLSLGEDPALPGSSPTLKAGGSSLELAVPDDEDDLVLGGSGAGSDVTHSPGDSGISLLDPTDSGLSIEEKPAEVRAGAVGSLDLGEDDMILLEDEKQSAADLKADDDFLLTPLDDGEDSDSGSQVIALDSEADLDEAATMLGGGAPLAPMLEEDELGAGDLSVPGGLGLAPGLGTGAPLLAAAQAPEVAYTGWNLALLSVCLVPLILSGMMMYDLARNMWSWDQPYAVNSSLMDAVLSWF
jgi:excisionase family DNA binding protein